MEMSGEERIPASQADTWAALNDPEMLRACVPGCDSIERIGDDEFQVLMVARIGPVSAKFKGKLTLSDVQPPNSYAIAFEGQGGAAGFAKGGAQVKLTPVSPHETKLYYDVKANVGGKLAQIGSRLVDAAAKKVADEFFQNFNKKMSSSEDPTVTIPGAPAHGHGGTEPVGAAPPTVSNTTLIFFAAGALVVFIVALLTLFG